MLCLSAKGELIRDQSGDPLVIEAVDAQEIVDLRHEYDGSFIKRSIRTLNPCNEFRFADPSAKLAFARLRRKHGIAFVW
jgi:hypothetical protein